MVKYSVTLLILGCTITMRSSTITAQAGTNIINQPGTVSFTFSAPQGSARAEVSVSFGSTFSFFDANCGGTNTCDVTGGASFSDTITIFGTSGTLQAALTVVHQRQDEGFIEGTFQLGTFHGAFSNAFCENCLPTAASGFSDGIPIMIGATTDGGARDFLPQDPLNGAGNAQSLIAFRNFGVIDASGQPLSGFRYVSESGTDYGIGGGVFVPDPSSTAFAAGGLLLILLCCRTDAFTPLASKGLRLLRALGVQTKDRRKLPSNS